MVMWGLFAVLVYNVITLERDYTEYDPFAILDLDRVSEWGRERAGDTTLDCFEYLAPTHVKPKSTSLQLSIVVQYVVGGAMGGASAEWGRERRSRDRGREGGRHDFGQQQITFGPHACQTQIK